MTVEEWLIKHRKEPFNASLGFYWTSDADLTVEDEDEPSWMVLPDHLFVLLKQKAEIASSDRYPNRIVREKIYRTKEEAIADLEQALLKVNNDELENLRYENRCLKEQVAFLRRELDRSIEIRQAEIRRNHEDYYDHVPYQDYDER